MARRSAIERTDDEVPIEGIGYRGYDNFKKKYVQFWVDSGGTGIYYSEGTADESGRVVTYFATVDDWHSGERDKPCKMVETIVDEDTVTLVMYDLTMPPGKDRLFEAVDASQVDASRAFE